jgi:hypothetical protein
MLQGPWCIQWGLSGLQGSRSSRSPLLEIRGPFHAAGPVLYTMGPLLTCRGPLRKLMTPSMLQGPLFRTTGLFWASGPLSGLDGSHFGNQEPFHAVGPLLCMMESLLGDRAPATRGPAGPQVETEGPFWDGVTIYVSCKNIRTM